MTTGQTELTSNSPRIIVAGFRPDQAFYRPGQPIRLLARLQADRPVEVGLVLQVKYLNETIATLSQALKLANETPVETGFELTLPATSPRGYGFDLSVQGPGTSLTVSTAADVLDGWPQMPRYGFFANFKADETLEESAARAWALSAYHVNVIQFYDWMYRHEDFIPPQDDFIDPMGRAVSYATVRHKIEAAHRLNMATLAYGAVYGATPAFWETHQDWGIYQADGQPYSLEKLFYLMDIRAGTPWYENILTQYEKAITQAGFDGIHIDQYGYPKLAYTRPVQPGEPPQTLELARLFPPVIDEAARRVAGLKPGGAVIFNAVNNWPVETVAATAQSAVYIEVWPPYTEYKDLRELILNARQLAGSAETKKQVILAAYLTPFLPAGLKVSDNATTEEAPHAGSQTGPAGPAQNLEGAQNAALLATATIYASGGFHLLLGEKNGVLADPYYPYYGQFQPDFVEKMQRYYDFVVRYENVLSNPTNQAVSPTEVEQALEIRQAGQLIELSGVGQAGKVWALLQTGPDFTSLNLINLAGLSNGLWNAFKETPAELTELEVSLKLPAERAGLIKSGWFASPDYQVVAQELPLQVGAAQQGYQRLTIKLPALAYWTLVVFS